jgi:anti-sigma factor ChrR (cupin superfamily)
MNSSAAQLVYRSLVPDGWRALAFEPFSRGVTVHWIRRVPNEENTLALLKYEPGGRVPRHLHTGPEMVLVLDGIQSDDNGDYPAGTYVINDTGSKHSVWSEGGCVVLIQWSRPVVLLGSNE